MKEGRIDGLRSFLRGSREAAVGEEGGEGDMEGDEGRLPEPLVLLLLLFGMVSSSASSTCCRRADGRRLRYGEPK